MKALYHFCFDRIIISLESVLNTWWTALPPLILVSVPVPANQSNDGYGARAKYRCSRPCWSEARGPPDGVSTQIG